MSGKVVSKNNTAQPKSASAKPKATKDAGEAKAAVDAAAQGATSTLKEGAVRKQSRQHAPNQLEDLIPVGSVANELREKAFDAKHTDADGVSHSILATLMEQHDLLEADDSYLEVKSGLSEVSSVAVAAMVGAHAPGCEATTPSVPPEAVMTPRVADPIQITDVELNFRPQPVFSDIVDGVIVTTNFNKGLHNA